MPARLRWIVLALGVLACRDAGLLSPREIMDLQRAEKRWHARAFADYTYEIQQLCFCPPEINRWTRVTVRSGRVVAAESVEPDAQFPVASLAFWQPIDSLFARLRAVARDQSGYGAFRDIVVEFDATLGFPTLIEWKERPGVADAGAVYHLRNVFAAN
jgi:hypothetical protein